MHDVLLPDVSHDDHFRALLAELAYDAPAVDAHDTCSMDRIQDSIQAMEQTHPEYADRLSQLEVIDANYDTVVFQEGDQCILSSRGTDLTPGQHTLTRDIYNDYLIASGDIPHRVNATEEMLWKHPECHHWEAVGHSAGGRVVEELGIRHPDITVTSFEAGRPLVGDDTAHNIIHQHDNITSHKVIGDPVCLGPSPGTSVYHVPNYGNITDHLNPLKNHALINYTY